MLGTADGSLSYYDSVTGTWNMFSGYDSLNRLTSAQATDGDNFSYKGLNVSWSYDTFGNRKSQNFTGNLTGSNPPAIPTPNSVVYLSNNRIGTVTPPPPLQPYSLSYDGAGNVLQDDRNNYLYDVEGRICAVQSRFGGLVYGYLYDANGTRVAKGTRSGWNCDNSGNNVTITTSYILGLNDEQLTELTWNAGTTVPAHTNVWTGGQLAATYTNSDPYDEPAGILYFHLSDWLGTRRVLTDSAGKVADVCRSLPYGDGEDCVPPAATEHMFTGKERDSESGNDYFGARYYASSMGRWLSPDKPFADQHTSNPQSWNLYAYGRNNPLRNVDSNGFKVLPAVLAEAVSKINTLPGGTLYIDFAGIQGLHGHPSLNPSNNFNGWHSDHSSANSVIVPNNGILSGFFRAFFGLANKDQVDTGKAIVAAAKAAGQDVAFDTYSNGVNAAGKVAQGMSAGDLQSATVVGPNANSPAPVQAMDQADGDTTQIYISINDPALALALFGSQSADQWTAEFGDRVHVTDQPSHNLNQYRGAQGKAPWPGFCPAEFASCN